MESALKITAPLRSASSIARAVLPLAVGPAIRVAPFSMATPPAYPDIPMALVATLISNPKAADLSQATANMAADALGATSVAWLAPEIACDIAVPAGLSREEAEGRLRG